MEALIPCLRRRIDRCGRAVDHRLGVAHLALLEVEMTEDHAFHPDLLQFVDS
jgi:hypothetical protein